MEKVLDRAHEVLGEVRFIAVNRAALERAASIGPPALRTLDALHLAALATLGDAVDVLITYDRRMQHAAEELRIPVESPA